MNRWRGVECVHTEKREAGPGSLQHASWEDEEASRGNETIGQVLGEPGLCGVLESSAQSIPKGFFITVSNSHLYE